MSVSIRKSARAPAVVVAVLGFTLGFASPSLAQDAAARFERGLQLFEEGRFDAALAEFNEAYRQEPAWQVLYNLGRVHAALGHAVEATDAYERYLRDGGDEIPRRRRREVEGFVAEQRARVAFVNVETNVAGAVVTLDGNDVATTPLTAPLRVAAGAHTVGARAPGHESAQRAVQLAGGVTENMRFDLRATERSDGTLRIESNIVDVEITIDGNAAGRTPLDATISVPSGRHVIQGTRAGYTSARSEVEVQRNTETAVRLDLRANENASANELGVLRLVVPNAERSVRLDGEVRPNTESRWTLPRGRHELRLEVVDREPYRQVVDVAGDATTEVRPDLQWTPAARAARVSGASTQRTIGWVMLVSGVAIAGAGTGLFAWSDSQAASSTSGIPAIVMNCPGRIRGGCSSAQERAIVALEDDAAGYRTIGTASLIALGVGAASAIVGLVLVLVAPSDDTIDASARASRGGLDFAIGPAGASVSGTF